VHDAHESALRPGAVAVPVDGTLSADVVIVGSGMGGGTLAWALRDSGLDVLLVERGGFLPREPQNAVPEEVFLRRRYATAEPWIDARTREAFRPGVSYWVGGNTKVYGACLPRFRESDFEATAHHDGISPAWPYTYADLEPFYTQAERLFEVHGELGTDPTEPAHSGSYPYPALPHEPTVERFAARLRQQGLHPVRMPNALHVTTIEERRHERASDGSPSPTGAKGDAENRAVRPALRSENVRILVGARVTRLETAADGRRVTEAVASIGSDRVRLRARTFVVACGAVNSSALLLRSANEHHPTGLGNSSGLVGRNYMVHNSTFLLGVHPVRRNSTAWQKTLGLNDWYHRGPADPYPLGNVQMLGKLQAPMVKPARPRVPMWALRLVTDRSIDLYLTTEDLPRLGNRVEVRRDQISIAWTPNNLRPHTELVKRMSTAVRRAGYPIVLSERMGIATNSHQCGTAVAGHDPARSVLDADCRSHDVANLFVVDSSFFPSSAALNPALTIAANALRVAPAVVAATSPEQASAS
jgi:choline dehydrogenase-like flavoprotein